MIGDTEGKIVWINNAFTQKTGYTLEEEAVGRYPAQLLHGPETDPETVRYMVEQMAKGESVRVEILDYAKNGTTFCSELYIQPVRDAAGTIQQYFALSTDITERKSLEARLLQEQKERQQAVTTAVIKAQEWERAQVGRELHDNVNQVLTTVKLYLELCLDDVPPKSAALIQKSMHLLNDSITEIRSLSKRLSAPTLGKISLKESVSELIESLSATNKISIALDLKEVAQLEVDPDLHLALYRILQEHLTNILKHAAAQHVAIIFDVVDGDLVLKVRDDGKGFDTQKKSSGIGIMNMTTRAESVNGSLILNSAPGLGCVLLARFPLLSPNHIL